MAAKPSAAMPASQTPTSKYNGQLLGLPQSGAGSMATIARRLAALVVDWALSYGLALLVAGTDVTTRGQFIPLSILALCYLIGLAINGNTIGMAVLGIRVTSETGGKASFQSIVLRTLLLFVALPAIMTDVDGRPLHDRFAKTVCVNGR